MNEYLRRIDERDYLTEREHREYLEKLNTDLEVLEILKKTLNNSFLCLIKNEEDRKKVKEWLEK